MVSKLPNSKWSKTMPLFESSHRLHCVYLAFLSRSEGEIWVDNARAPNAALLLHPFMAVIAGDPGCRDAKKLLAKIHLPKIIAPTDSAWDAPIKELFGEKAIQAPRTKFAEEPPNSRKVRAALKNIAAGYSIQSIDRKNIGKVLETFKDGAGIIGLFWDKKTFLRESFGYVAVDKNGNLVSLSIMGTPLHNGMFEIHTETHPDHRRKGLATATNAALITEAAKRKIIPLWDAANENSAKLATRLGFRAAENYNIFFYYVPEAQKSE